MLKKIARACGKAGMFCIFMNAFLGTSLILYERMQDKICLTDGMCLAPHPPAPVLELINYVLVAGWIILLALEFVLSGRAKKNRGEILIQQFQRQNTKAAKEGPALPRIYIVGKLVDDEKDPVDHPPSKE